MNKDKKQRGILVANAFLRTGKFTEHYQWLQRAAANLGVQLEYTDNASHLNLCGEELSWLAPYDFVLFWDKDAALGKEIGRQAEMLSIPVYNSIDAVLACDDKLETYRRISMWNQNHPGQEVPLIPTIAAPMTYENVGYTRLDFLEQVEDLLGYPVVVKECFGSFGMQVYLAADREELCRLTKKLAGRPFVYQRYQRESSGRDVRLQVVGKRVAAAMYRQAQDGDFRANISHGGQMNAYEPTRREEELAVLAAEILGLDFAGVDLLFGEDGQAEILCEVNSNAHFKNIYTCTGVNVADCILEYIVSKGRGR